MKQKKNDKSLKKWKKKWKRRIKIAKMVVKMSGIIIPAIILIGIKVIFDRVSNFD